MLESPVLEADLPLSLGCGGSASFGDVIPLIGRNARQLTGVSKVVFAPLLEPNSESTWAHMGSHVSPWYDMI